VQSVSTISGNGPLVLTCEHASCSVPSEYDSLGLDPEDLREHIGWDIGARRVTELLAHHFDSTAVLAGISRLVIDCNRDLGDHDLIVAESHGVRIPGNTRIDAEERQRRIRDFYQSYHDAVDAALVRRRDAFLLSVHSFTPALSGRERRFDVGVLFDVFADEANQLGTALARTGLRIRYNEPYSGFDGLIFSARTHGGRHGLRYVELEINNALLRTDSHVAAVAERIATALTIVF
jgi:predicted N-formylglutamate amidohydrolase